ncbi:MAG: hypothetical protein G01um101438_345 [Parcubacteria group bacterium Gr01-1014_38]|nr:MAG: hypothetical protein G01um101438_345 [Parcubacteria group bacterium Gr01-1014_38]
MLTHTDIHYLVGLLTRVEEADDVIVELGDMVYDSAANEERDVDITVTYTDKNGEKTAYKGVEVKDHSRPLDVQKVEELCQKLADMPDITHKAIVSASGYRDGAIKKAQAHGVELLEIADWLNPYEGFNVKFTDNALTLIEPEWVDGPHVRINVAKKDIDDLSGEYQNNPRVCNKLGDTYPHAVDLNTLSRYAHSTVSNKIQWQTDPIRVRHGESIPIHTAVLFSEAPYIKLRNKLVLVENCTVTGEIYCIVHDKPAFRVLRQYGSEKPISGCIMVELKNHNLTGISVSNSNNKITALNIPYADRVKKTIRKHRIGRRD